MAAPERCSPFSPWRVLQSRPRRRRGRPARRPLFFIDLGVPRNCDPRLNELDNVFLYDIDDLKKVIDDNKDERAREAVKAEAILAQEVEAFWS
jgi:glutamyl-tRNA reductase